jgi:Flp pilus assembly pilin Flp
MNAPQPRRIPARRHRQRGVAAVEFALLAGLFFMVLFGTIEIARYTFLLNTLQEVTRHAARDAAVTDFSNTAELAKVQQRALFRTTAGELVLSGNIDDTSVQIDYLSFDGTPVSPPACPALNASNCIDDPHGPSCIRFVRVRLCETGTSCQGVPYVPMLGLLNNLFPSGVNAVRLPVSTTVTPMQPVITHSSGTPPCP